MITPFPVKLSKCLSYIAQNIVTGPGLDTKN